MFSKEKVVRHILYVSVLESSSEIQRHADFVFTQCQIRLSFMLSMNLSPPSAIRLSSLCNALTLWVLSDYTCRVIGVQVE
jgi:hypothetical protein